MQRLTPFRLTSAFAASALLAVFVVPGARAADPCDVAYVAAIKTVQTPHHVYSTTTPRGGKARADESIYAGGVEYLKLHGNWRRSPLKMQDRFDMAKEKLATHPDTCTRMGAQSVDGQAVVVYKLHNREVGADQQVRIRNADGLLQGVTETLPNGTLIEVRYEYGNVQAPAGL